MFSLNKGIRIGVFASILSLFFYVAYVTHGSYAIFFGFLSNKASAVSYVSNTGPVFWLGHIGLTARFVGIVLGIVAVMLLWLKSWPFSKVNKLVAFALAFEAVNFLGLIPSVPFLLGGRLFNLPLGLDYILLILLTVPFLAVLSVKAFQYKEANKPSLLFWASIAFAAYVSALVVNEVARWISMIFMDASQFLAQGARLIGFLNAVAFMPFAIVFAVLGAVRLIKGNQKSALKWMGASLAVIGLNYAIYVVYLYYANWLSTLPLVDAWTIPLLVVGLAMIWQSVKTPKAP